MEWCGSSDGKQPAFCNEVLEKVVVSGMALIGVVSGGVAKSLLVFPARAQEEGERLLVNRQPSLVIGQPSLVEDQSQLTTDQGQITNDSLLLSEIEQPATTIAGWMAQIEASLVQITEVRGYLHLTNRGSFLSRCCFSL
ncbi:hypothetical protein HJG54_00110 [Leptolyngbya sp. NK1-12]|uniref:Uncharacterized protein n=1 Tax=Leptolyngbya sp. NK1-12 TaxID=2547451 RepID=A0AA97AG45_9CYAN|nr:hypothetical protein [Leptolyngbya sp. NK1-12]WNZ21421.1 hypothetical protein HJG54_00110 [Leptolyngbya sp. NK1-12]